MRVFQRNTIGFTEVTLYYFAHFIRRLQFLVPFALLLSTLTVLCQMSLRRELLALLVGGISKKQIFRPFLVIALLSSGSIYLNFEYLEPYTLPYIDQFEVKYFHSAERKGNQIDKLSTLYLEDGSKMIYQKYDMQKQALFDVFWVLSPDAVIHMKYFKPDQIPPLGSYVDQFTRNQEGRFIRMTSENEKIFPQIKFKHKDLKKVLKPLENYALSELWQTLQTNKEGKIARMNPEEWTMWYFKILIPLISLWVVITTVPECFIFDRQVSIFKIYCWALFLLVFFFTAFNSAVILGQSGVISPLIALGGTMFLFFAPSMWRFYSFYKV
jgi:lipopolysaccharide export LptBFGC system permease protein LptF